MPYLGLPGEMAQRLMSGDPVGTTVSDIKTVSSRLTLVGGTAAVSTTGIPFYVGTRAVGAVFRGRPMITQPVQLYFHYQSNMDLLNYIQYGMIAYNSFNSNGTGPPISVASPTDHIDTPHVSGGRPESRHVRSSAHGVSQGRPSRKLRRRSRRGSCPPGHYWSWKKKTCVKSKYR